MMRIALLLVLLWPALAAAASWGFSVAEAEKGGAVITAVEEDSAAALAGVEPGDRILVVAGKQTRNAPQVVRAVQLLPRDRLLTLLLERRGWQGRFLLPAPEPALPLQANTTEQEQLLQQAFTLERAKEHEQALTAYYRVLRAGPPHPTALYGAGWSLNQLERYAEAEHMLVQLLSLTGQRDANLLMSLGLALAKQGKLSGAITAWNWVAHNDKGEAGRHARDNLEWTRYGLFLLNDGPPERGRSDGRKVHLVVAPFERLMEGERKLTGDGLRRMLRDGLLHSGYFAVDELDDDISRSSADVVVHGVITKFDEAGKVVNLHSYNPANVLLGLGQRYQEAHVSVELRFVDRRSGAELAQREILGVSITTQTQFTMQYSMGRVRLPGAFEIFRNTPMERALTDFLHKAVTYSMNAVPEKYFQP